VNAALNKKSDPLAFYYLDSKALESVPILMSHGLMMVRPGWSTSLLEVVKCIKLGDTPRVAAARIF
jgi:hypothetical protein